MNLFDREGIARVTAKIAQSIHVYVALGLEAADAELVSVHAAIAFADRDGHPGHAAQRLIEGGDVLLADLRLPDNVDRLRRVLDRARQAADTSTRIERV